MYLARLGKGRQLNDCDAASWYTGRVKAAAEGLSKSKDCPFAVPPDISKDQVCQWAKTFSFRADFTLRASLDWISLLRIKSGALSMGRRVSPENMSEMGQANPLQALGMVGGRQALKLRR